MKTILFSACHFYIFSLWVCLLYRIWYLKSKHWHHRCVGNGAAISLCVFLSVEYGRMFYSLSFIRICNLIGSYEMERTWILCIAFLLCELLSLCACTYSAVVALRILSRVVVVLDRVNKLRLLVLINFVIDWENDGIKNS